MQLTITARGIGSQTLVGCCPLPDHARDAGHLGTDEPEDVRPYGGFGFEVRGEAGVLGVPNRFMSREPGS